VPNHDHLVVERKLANKNDPYDGLTRAI
jgi:hypothetical protein